MEKKEYKKRMGDFRSFYRSLEEWEMSEVENFDDQEIVEIFKKNTGWGQSVDLLLRRAGGDEWATPVGRQKSYGCQWEIYPISSAPAVVTSVAKRKKRFFLRVEARSALKAMKMAEERLNVILQYY
ncbi:MAG: hypothetical protein WAV16_04425 [Candidatus Moraniibacteriota bacterium]